MCGNEWATSKQSKFIRSLIKQKIGVWDQRIKIGDKVFRTSKNNNSGLYGGVMFCDASNVIKNLLANNLEKKLVAIIGEGCYCDFDRFKRLCKRLGIDRLCPDLNDYTDYMELAYDMQIE